MRSREERRIRLQRADYLNRESLLDELDQIKRTSPSINETEPNDQARTELEVIEEFLQSRKPKFSRLARLFLKKIAGNPVANLETDLLQEAWIASQGFLLKVDEIPSTKEGRIRFYHDLNQEIIKHFKILFLKELGVTGLSYYMLRFAHESVSVDEDEDEDPNRIHTLIYSLTMETIQADWAAAPEKWTIDPNTVDPEKIKSALVLWLEDPYFLREGYRSGMDVLSKFFSQKECRKFRDAFRENRKKVHKMVQINHLLNPIYSNDSRNVYEVDITTRDVLEGLPNRLYYQGWVERFVAEADQITSSPEVKQALLDILHLGLSTEDAAKKNNVVLESVRSARSRLKRRLKQDFENEKTIMKYKGEL